MTKSIKLTNKKVTKLMASTTMMFSALVVALFVGFNHQMVFAEQTDTINSTKIVTAPIDVV